MLVPVRTLMELHEIEGGEDLGEEDARGGDELVEDDKLGREAVLVRGDARGAGVQLRQAVAAVQRAQRAVPVVPRHAPRQAVRIPHQQRAPQHVHTCAV